MKNPELLLPALSLVWWTMLVLMLIPYRRIRAARLGQVSAKDFRYGESAQVPAEVVIANRALMNLLELPLIFYFISVLSTFLLQTEGEVQLATVLAWAYVLLRYLHTIVQLTYNNVIHRLIVFALSNLVLAALIAVVSLALLQAI